MHSLQRQEVSEEKQPRVRVDLTAEYLAANSISL